MSTVTTIQITCPACNTEQDYTMRGSVNGAERPDLKEELLAGRLNVTTCPTCKRNIQVAHPIFYSDPSHKYWIWLLPAPEEADPEELEEIEEVLEDEVPADFICRTVREMNEFLEKIRVLEDGLDDRVMEILKMFIMFNTHPEVRKDPESLVYYNRMVHDTEGDEYIQFMAVGRYETTTLNLKIDAYTYMQMDFKPFLITEESVRGEWLEVDQLYARSALEGLFMRMGRA